MPPGSTPASTLRRGSEPIAPDDWPPELLTGALERAVTVARRDLATRDAPSPPSSIRPVLGFTRLPSRALRTVQLALDRDDAFRARVAEGAEESALGRASWLFLHRPDGWFDELGELAAQVEEEQRDTEALRAEQSAQRRAEQLADSVDRLRDDLALERRAAQDALAQLERARGERHDLVTARDELAARVASLEEERARAVRELKATEAASASRLDELRDERARRSSMEEQVRALEAALAERAPVEDADRLGTEGTPPPAAAGGAASDPVDLGAVAVAVDRAARAAALLGDALAEAVAALVPVAVEADHRPDAPIARSASSGPPAGAPTGPPPRRVPVRLHSGVHDGTAEGLRQLLGVDGMVAIVDGYNVTMEGWPTLDHQAQRNSLLRALAGVQAQVPAAIHVVFDGDDDGRRPAVGAPLPVRVHFSAADTEADDVILSMVTRLPTDTPVLVVSSDRRVAEGARRLGANAVRSSVLLELLRR